MYFQQEYMFVPIALILFFKNFRQPNNLLSPLKLYSSKQKEFFHLTSKTFNFQIDTAIVFLKLMNARIFVLKKKDKILTITLY